MFEESFDDPGAAGRWTTEFLLVDGGATESIETKASGGNPAGFRLIQHHMPPVSNQWVYHLYTAATYDPSEQGAISHVVFGEDRIIIGPPFSGSQFTSGMAIRQNAII